MFPLKMPDRVMCLAYDLYDSMGRTMVGSGCELTASYINKLNEYGFSGIYIEDEQSKDIYIEATIPEKTAPGRV